MDFQKTRFLLERIGKKRYQELRRAPFFPGRIRSNKGFYLLACDFRVTWRCNSRCIFCDIWKLHADPEAYERDHGVGLNTSIDEMSTEEIKKALDDLADMDTQEITFSGGEPSLRKDLCELIAHASRKGMNTIINTNGFLLNDAYAEKLVTSGLGVANFSIDAPNAQLHDSFRGAGAFQKAVRGLKAVRRMSRKHNKYVWINVNAVLTRKNYRLLTDFIDLKKEWDYDSFSLVPVNTSENEGAVYKNTDEFKLSADDIHQIKEILSGDTLREFRKAGLVTVLPFGETEEEIRLNVENCYTRPGQYCATPWLRTVVQPNGDVLPCCYSPGDYVMGNLRTNSIAEIWDGALYRSFRAKCKPASHPICRWCSLFKHANERWTPILKLVNRGSG